MKRLSGTAIASTFLIATILQAAPPASADAPTGFIHRQGMGLVDGNNQPVRLKGVNFGNWLMWEPYLMGGSGANGQTQMLGKLASVAGQTASTAFQDAVTANYTTLTDFQQVAAQGLNVVRVPFDYRMLEDDSAPGVYKDSGWAVLDNVVNWADQAGVYVVLDMHAAPGAQGPIWTADATNGAQLWTNASFQDRTVNLWKAIAARYANRTSVAAYDLLNEPLTSDTATLKQIYAKSIAAIRSVDANHLVMLEGTAFTTNNSMFTTRLDENMAISFHQYLYSTLAPARDIANVEKVSTNLNVPLWVGETGNDTAANISTEVNRFNSDSKISGYAVWTWKAALPSGGHHEVNEFTPSATWKKVIQWVSGAAFAPKPTLAEVNKGMSDYLSAITTAAPNTAVQATLK